MTIGAEEPRSVTIRGRLLAVNTRLTGATLAREGEIVGREVGVVLAEALRMAGIGPFDGEAEIIVHLKEDLDGR